MPGETQDPGERTQEEISAARRAAMLRFAIEQQEERHFAEAQDMYRQLIDEYPGTEEESEARERMLDLAYAFGSERQPYRMLSLYNTLETMYVPTSTERQTEARRARVKEILEEVHQQKMREAEAEARLEAIRGGRAPEPATPPPERATPPEREKPAREPRTRVTGRQRVGQIQEEVREQKQREAETEARIEAIREGQAPEPASMPPERATPAEPATPPPEGEKPAREP